LQLVDGRRSGFLSILSACV